MAFWANSLIYIKGKGGGNIIPIIYKWFISSDQSFVKARTKINSNKKQKEINLHYPSRAFCGYLFLGIAAFSLTIFFALASHRNDRMEREVSNVHYMDTVNSNYLFRGGLPLIGNPPVFNYNGLKKAIINAGKRAGIKVPSSFYIIDVSFLNIENPADARRISAEQKFFQNNPRLGRIQVWGMNGIGLDATDPALLENREYLARNLDKWLNDKLTSRVEILRGWLEGTSPAFRDNAKQPFVIYIHCVAGCDRTGEFSGAYYLRYQNKTWEEVNALNRSMCHHNRPFGCKNYRAVQWYCLWLNLKRGFALNWWKDFSCSGK